MELRHLRYFIAVADHNSFTAAARRVHVSQSALSGQIRDLEDELGVTLFDRNNRAVALSPEGEVFIQEARQIVAHAERAREMALRASRGELGELTVGFCGPATASFLPSCVRDFRLGHPDVALSLRDINPVGQLVALVGDDIDVGFTRTIPKRYRELLISEVLYREPVLAVLPASHPLTKKRAIRLIDLAEEPFVLYYRDGEPEMFDTIIGMCKRAKFSPRIIDSPDLVQTVLTWIESEQGVSLVPACVRLIRPTGVTFRKLDDDATLFDLVMVVQRGKRSPARDAFLEVVRKKISAFAKQVTNF